MSLLGTIMRGVRRRVTDWADPICQNPNALLYDTYKGVAVQLVPLYEGNGGRGRIVQWIPDPAVTQALDAAQQPRQQPQLQQPSNPPLLPPLP